MWEHGKPQQIGWKNKESKNKKTKHWRESEMALVLGGLDFERYREG